MMKAPKPPPEDPAVKAAREREERRADQANLGAIQETLRRLTRAQRRRFGIVAGSGGSAGVNPSLVAAALSGTGGEFTGSGDGGGGGGSFGGDTRGFRFSDYL